MMDIIIDKGTPTKAFQGNRYLTIYNNNFLHFCRYYWSKGCIQVLQVGDSYRYAKNLT